MGNSEENEPITEELVTNCVLALIKYPGSIAKAAAEIGMKTSRLRRAYTNGWPSYNVPPLKQLAAIRTAELRAEAFMIKKKKATDLAVRSEEAVAAAVQFEKKELVDNLELTYTARQMAATVNSAAGKLMAKAEQMIINGLNEEDFQDLPIDVQLKALKTIADIGKQSVSVSEAAIKLHKLVLGEPIGAFEHKHKLSEAPADDTSQSDMDFVIDTAKAITSDPTANHIIDVEYDE